MKRGARQIGRIGEALFDAFAAAQGWVVAEPRVEHVPFDRLLWRSHVEPAQRVQVKATDSANRQQQFCLKHGARGSRYTSSSFDLLSMVDIRTSEIWLVPWQGAVTGMKYATPRETLKEFQVWSGWMQPTGGRSDRMMYRTRNNLDVARDMLGDFKRSLRHANVLKAGTHGRAIRE